MVVDLGQKALQGVFGAMIDVSQPRVAQLVGDGILPAGGTYGEWLHAYAHRLREQAAGRASGDIGGLDLVQERAALAREQRVGYEIKNAVARGEYAPISALASTLATASQAVVDRFDLLPGRIKKVCPDLPDAVRTQIEATIAEARNEWVASTVDLVVKQIGGGDDAEGGEGAE